MEDVLLAFMSLNLSGLQTRCLRCNATTVGCFGFHEPCCVGGLPINLLLLLELIGVASTVAVAFSITPGNGDCILDVRHTLCGSHTNDCLPTRLLLDGTREVLLSGVAAFMFDSGRKVAMEARLLG